MSLVFVNPVPRVIPVHDADSSESSDSNAIDEDHPASLGILVYFCD
jgi:hypothetical protein